MRIDGIPIIENSAFFTPIAPSLGGGFRVAVKIAPKPNGKPRFMQCQTPQRDYLIMVAPSRNEAEFAVRAINSLESHSDLTNSNVIELCRMPIRAVA